MGNTGAMPQPTISPPPPLLRTPPPPRPARGGGGQCNPSPSPSLPISPSHFTWQALARRSPCFAAGGRSTTLDPGSMHPRPWDLSSMMTASPWVAPIHSPASPACLPWSRADASGLRLGSAPPELWRSAPHRWCRTPSVGVARPDWPRAPRVADAACRAAPFLQEAGHGTHLPSSVSPS